MKELSKAFLVGCMCYYTYTQGLWGTSFDSSCFLGKFIERCPPESEDEFNEYISATLIQLDEDEPCAPFIPRTDYLLYQAEAPKEFLDYLRSLLWPPPKPIIKSPCDK
ncbi:hypothetical protein Phum_PHUM324110 [Pediculus humanus corporis]|uniref:Uncharacterized protein n=1 Tax=Pediculus humanus subsp. corporis TaxID=121224 RepID=E0VN16_PEDHC|nr:uncharacterized protein Phum_PHUM324110 [Pediculus humanus corporis]EEB14772.1 hypothetical protein Phum_PHUM324110 [Pediculus humanus corporis]